MSLRWYFVLCAVLAMLVARLVQAAPEQYILAVGRLGATDQEIHECSFSVGHGAMLVLRPEGEPCVRARELIGRTGILVFVPDVAQEIAP